MDRNFAPNYYPAGTKVIFEDGTNNILRSTDYLAPGWYHLGKKILAIEIPNHAVNQTAEQRRIAQAGAEIGRQAAEQVERMAREGREREERMDRERAEQAVRRREERRRIENALPYDNNNPALPNIGNPPHTGGRKSRRGRKSKKSRKTRSMKRRSRRSRR